MEAYELKLSQAWSDRLILPKRYTWHARKQKATLSETGQESHFLFLMEKTRTHCFSP